MSNPIVIAVDAMGGDHGPDVTVPAVVGALRGDRDLRVLLVGRTDALNLILDNTLGRHRSEFAERLKIHDAPEVVGMDERPQEALRKKKSSSMRVALDLVKAGEAQACVSAGNTGALMATAKFVLKTLPGIDRPAMLSRMPSHHGHTVMLDLGANAECTPELLLQFAVMGAVVAKDTDGAAPPRVGLLNIGEEDIKGNAMVKEAHKLLSASKLNYIGFVEGNDIFRGEVDVVVTDGFTGNVALKSMEGVASIISKTLRSEFMRNPWRKFVGFLSLPVLNSMRKRFDPREHGGASMVGLNAVVIKSHGSADAYTFGNALRLAVTEARKGVPTQIAHLMQEHATAEADTPSPDQPLAQQS